MECSAAAVRQLCRSGDVRGAARLAVAAGTASGGGASAVLPYAYVLQALAGVQDSAAPAIGAALHARALRLGIFSDRFVSNSLLTFYYHIPPFLSHFSHALKLFDEMPLRDAVACTSVMTAYNHLNRPLDALKMFVAMPEKNHFAVSAAVHACTAIGEPRIGASLHSLIVVSGHGLNHVIMTALVHMYGRFSLPEYAVKAFREIRSPDRFCWTSVIAALTRNDRFSDAVSHFRAMLRTCADGVLPDTRMFGTLMSALGNLGEPRRGKEAHAKAVILGQSGHVVLGSSVVDMYAKCGLLHEARKVFDRMESKNDVSWCALLNGYCQSGEHSMVLRMFRKMGKNGDQYSFGTVLRACTGLAAVRNGKEVHCQYLRMGFRRDAIIESAIVDLYAKCGLVDYAYQVFLKHPARSTITWNAMISGFAQNGRGEAALELFDEMVRQGVRPDNITFVGVFVACSHTGMVDLGRKHFNAMRTTYHIDPDRVHYNCIVDLYCRRGLVEEAEQLIEGSSLKRDMSILADILGACATYSNLDVGERVAGKMMEVDPRNHLSYVLLANVYRAAGRWHDASRVEELRSARRAKKMPGRSWTDADRNIRLPPDSESVSRLSSEEDAVSFSNQGMQDALEAGLWPSTAVRRGYRV